MTDQAIENEPIADQVVENAQPEVVVENAQLKNAQPEVIVENAENAQPENAQPEVIVENAQPEVVKKVYSCNFCDKIFHCPRALGGHQNAHRRERAAMKRPMAQQYDPYRPWAMPPPSFSDHYGSTLNPRMNNLYGSSYNNRYSSQSPHLRHHPYYPYSHQYGSTSEYQSLRNHLFGTTKATALPRVCPSINIPSVPATQNPSMNIPSVPTSLNIPVVPSSLKPPSLPSLYGDTNQNAQRPLLGDLNHPYIEKGSSSGANQGKGDAEKEDGKEELDLTLRL